VLAFVAAVAAQTRAGWAGLAAAALVAAPGFYRWLRLRPWLPAAGAIALIALAIATPAGPRVISAFDFEDGAARGRIDEWQVGAAVLANHPVAGTGFEGYRIAFAEGVDADYERRYTRQVMPDRAHNGALDVAVTTGAPGLVLYVIAVIWLLRRSWRAARSGVPWLVGLGAGVAGYLVQQQFLFPIAEFDPVFWMFAGVLVAATARAAPLGVRFPSGAWLVPVALATAAFVAGGLDVAADHAARSALATGRAGEPAAALAQADRAVDLRPDSIRYHFVAATVAAEAETITGLEAALERLDGALDLSPRDPILRAEHASLRLDLARATGSTIDLAGARTEWEHLVDTDPNHARYRLELGIAQALAGDGAAAENSWLAAADLAPSATAPLTNLALLYLGEDRFEDAASVIARIRTLDPATPGLADLERSLP
jgi:hypothetical protein